MSLKRTPGFLLAMFIVVSSATIGQTHSPEAERFLLSLPAPALDAAEALTRCPDQVDTLMQSFLAELTHLAAADTASIPSAYDEWRFHTKYLAHHLTQLEREIFAAGEQVDKEILSCPKVGNAKGQSVFEPVCVQTAERKGHRHRVAAVDHYLSMIHTIWPEFMGEIRKLVHRTGSWQIVLNTSTTIARITETAAQYSR
ncbi:MAG: hypothetical protein KF749_06475 [Bacteroidetes bacterium]|nr:hypothetical protein [Bacteroidota bacterium]MCW5896877.1 hypothetical protein [Bacteroidota bacterium]